MTVHFRGKDWEAVRKTCKVPASLFVGFTLGSTESVRVIYERHDAVVVKFNKPTGSCYEQQFGVGAYHLFKDDIDELKSHVVINKE